MTKRKVVCQMDLAGLALAGILALPAAAIAQAPASQARFVDRVDVNVGNVEVTVQDKNGNLVSGLTREDFLLYVDGKLQDIEYFGAYTRAAQTLAAETRTPQGEEGEIREAPTPPRQRRVQVIFIDSANTTVFNRNHILGRVAEYVRRTLRPPDLAMVAVYENSLRFISPLSSNADELAYLLEEMRRETANVGGHPTYRAMAERQIRDLAERQTQDQAVRAVILDQAIVTARMAAQQIRNHTEQTVGAFKLLLRTMSGVPGRKSVLYISDGLPRSPGIETFQLLTEFFPQARMGDTEFQTYETTGLWHDLARWAAGADVTFYTVDARGLKAGAEKSAEHGRHPPGVRTAGSRPVFGDIEVLHLQNYQDPLIAMANVTGGITVINTNEFDKGLQRISEAMETYYSLGFPLAERNQDVFHDIRVDLKDRKDLRLRYRTGLLARSLTMRMADRAYAGLTFGVLENPLAIRALLGEPRPAGKKRYTLPVKVLVPVDKVALLPSGDEYRGRITVWTVAAGAGNKLSPLDRQEHEIVVPADKMSRLGTLTIDLSVEVPEGECRVSVAVLDEATGEVGFAAADAIPGPQGRRRG